MINFVEVEKQYKDKILNIWKEFEKLYIFENNDFNYRKYPIAPKKVFKSRLLFIGINPSFSKGSVVPDCDIENKIGFYSNEFIDDKVDIHYFQKMKEVAKYCHVNWTHLDLFFLRETNQKVIEKLTYNKKGIDFLSKQLDISFKILEESEPKLIIVSNAYASEFFGKRKKKHHNLKKIWKGFELFFERENIKGKEFKSSFNENLGTYEIKLNNKKVPILFSGMLSGQRALDIGSLERLKWQAKFILENKKVSKII